MKQLQVMYLIKEPRIPDFYLGATYTGSSEEDWSIMARAYIREAVKQIENKHGIML
jgi:hypothetical protein